MDRALRHSSLVGLFDDEALDGSYPVYRQLRAMWTWARASSFRPGQGPSSVADRPTATSGTSTLRTGSTSNADRSTT